MRSIWGLYKSARTQDDDDSTLTSVVNSLGTLTTKVNTTTGYAVGSIAARTINVASVSAIIPAAGVSHFDTTRKVALYSDGTSMFLATGSLA